MKAMHTFLTKTTLLFTLLVSLTIGALSLPYFAHAQAGVSISPALIEETLDPGFTETYRLEIENLQPSSQTYYLSTRNISDVRAGGIPVFAEPGQRTGMELADWVDLPVTEVQLERDQKTVVEFTLNVPENASPGGHFGGIFISVEPPDIERSGAAVGYQVANILSIRVSGEVDESASIRQFSTDSYLYGSQDVTFNARIENTGNVLIRPTGPLTINNMLGEQVALINFNEDTGGVFPDSIRDFQIEWEGQGIGFGRYEAILSAVYGIDGAKKTISSTATFWVLPMNIIGPALGVLAVLLLLVFVFVRIYINRTLARMSGGRTRMVRNRRRQGPSSMLLLTVVMLVVVALFLIVLLALFA